MCLVTFTVSSGWPTTTLEAPAATREREQQSVIEGWSSPAEHSRVLLQCWCNKIRSCWCHWFFSFRPSWCNWSNWDSRLGPRNRNEWTHYRPAASAFVVCVQRTRRPATLIFIRRNVLLFPERNQDRKENTSCLSTPGPSRGPAGLLDIHQ